MEIIEIEEGLPDPVTAPPDRSSGLHVTDIIADIEKEIGKVYSDGWDRDSLFEIGFIWEELLSLAFASRHAVRPPEMELDGISLSPDGLDITDWVVEEYKCTFKGVKHTPDTIWRWVTQAKAYVKAVGRHPETGEYPRVKWRVLHLNGDWAGSGPLYKVYLAKFSEQEIEECWEMLLNHAKAKGWI